MLQRVNRVWTGEQDEPFSPEIAHPIARVDAGPLISMFDGPAPSAMPVYFGATDYTYSVPFDLPEPVVFNLTAILDVNGDGALDAIVAYAKNGGGTPLPIDVLLGDGAGGFALGTDAVFGGSTPAPDGPGEFPIVADFNGDSRPDLYLYCSGLDASPFPGAPGVLLLSQGAHGFVDASGNLPSFTDFNTSSPVGDIDGDGDVDILVGNSYDPGGHPGPYFLLNDGTGVFHEGDLLPEELDGDPYLERRSSFCLFDADGDNDVDLLAGGTKWHPSQLFSNDGHGHFTYWADLPVPGGIPPIYPPPDDYGASAGFRQAIDLNNDGKLDLIARWGISGPAGQFQILINRGGGQFTDETIRIDDYLLPNGEVSAAFPTLVDVNGDGFVDFVSDVMPSAGRPIYLNDGSGYFVRLPDNFFDIDLGSRIAPGDFNDDGRLDFLLSNEVGAGEAHVRIVLGVDPGLTLAGNNAADALMGDESSEVFSGKGGSDVIFGAQGDDVADGGSGTDKMFGGSGDDSLAGGLGDDFLAGGSGDDTIDGGGGGDTASYRDAIRGVTVSLALAGVQATGHGNDQLGNVEWLIGSNYGDKLTGDDGGNRLEGGEGNDKLEGGDGDDLLSGGMGNDKLFGQDGSDAATYADALAGVIINLALTAIQNTVGSGHDKLTGIETLIGSAFDDVLSGNAGNTELDGGDGDDTLGADAGDDTVDGGAGLDLVSYASANAGVTVHLAGQLVIPGFGTDTLKSIEGILGSRFADSLTGGNNRDLLAGAKGDDALVGGKGNDTLRGGAGNDSIDGGKGFDIADYSDAGSGVTVDLSVAGPQATGGAGSDTLARIEAVAGSAFGDTLTAAVAGSTLYGGEGDDSLTGGNGNDVLAGGSGDNLMDGGNGNDTFVLSADGDYTLVGGAGTDTIDFSALDLSAAPRAVTIGLFQEGDPQPPIDTNIGSITLFGIENVIGSSVGTFVHGTGGDNVLYCGARGGWLNGQGGSDTIVGGAWDGDVLRIGGLGESTNAAPDRFINLGNGDQIDLHDIDADTGASGDQAFAIAAAFTHHAGELVLTYDSTHDRTVITADVNGDAVADMTIWADGDHTDFTGFAF